MRIKVYRKAAGLSQRQLAKMCGDWAITRISNYENRHRTPCIDDAWAIVDAINAAGVDCGFDDIFPPPVKNKAA